MTERTAALVLFPDPAIDFTCDFSSVVSGISANHQIAADKITTEGSNGVGSFQYELDFMVRTPQGTRFVPMDPIRPSAPSNHHLVLSRPLLPTLTISANDSPT